MRQAQLLSALLFVLTTAVASAEIKPVPNPCGLLTVQEASAVVGSPVKVGMHMDEAGICMFVNAKGNPVLSITGTIYENAGDATESFQSVARIATKPVEQVSGVGDKAEFNISQGGDISLIVQKGAKMLLLQLKRGSGPDLASRKPAMVQAARQSAGRL